MSEARSPHGAITFVIPGQRDSGTRSAGAGAQAVPTGLTGRMKASVRVSARRTAGEAVRVTAVPGEDVVVLQIAGGPTLMLHPESARDLMLGQSTTTRSARGKQPAGGEDVVAVPAQLSWRGLEGAAPAATATRGSGFLGRVLLSTFQVVTGFRTEPVVDFVTSAVLKRVDGQVDPGVYALKPETLPALKGSGLKIDAVPAEAAAAGPLLVLLHGTFVDTHSTFGKLWVMFPQRVRELFQHYGGRVYALDHPTLGASPIANALTLVRALPKGSRLHLATHSRGGLVAEVLARVAGAGVGAADLAYFKDAAYAGQRAELQALGSEMAKRQISVERVVRVACPARGTLLASKRLDAYLSVLRWGLDRAQIPVLPALLEFLGEVARRRADPQEIPGLAAMIADTPLVTWLNDAEEPVPGELRVVAGDLQGDSVGSWLKTLLADAYYWTDNDVVVQTRSMYGGSPRVGGASFLLDQGGQVTHFNYFANARTVDAVVSGLTQSQPQGFRPIGPLSWAGQDSGGLRAARRSADDQPAAERPAVFVLPGILGSHLKVGDKRIWLSLRLIGGLKRLTYQPDGADQVQADGPIGMVYDDLIDHLAATHEVIPFAFDWRRPIEEEARRLADAVDAALDARAGSNKPVRLLAHSMGGVLARTLQLERPQTWARLMLHEGARLVMLGTPNGGSWAPMQVLSGDDTFGNALASFGSPLRDRQARQIMANMPGFLQLQAGLLDESRHLDKAETWARIAADDLKRVQDNNWWHSQARDGAMDPAYEWGLPPQEVLNQARRLRQRLDAQRDTTLKQFADKLLLVTGRAKFTPDGYEVGDDGFVYLNATDGGDGRVPLSSALLPGVKTWTLDCEHGSLPDAEAAFPAFVELLQRGDTQRLPRLAGQAGAAGLRSASAGGAKTEAPAPQASAVVHVRSRPSRSRQLPLPAETLRGVFNVASAAELGATAAAADRGTALQVTVLNGNLCFVREPLLVGHYRSSVLTGTERAIDRMVEGAMQAALSAGLYPDPPGTHQVFVNNGRDPGNPWRAPRPASVIVIGMGEEGKLREQELTLSVRQGVLAWAQRVAEAPDGAPATISLAATLMGSGGLGISPGGAARAIAQGVRDANERLARAGWPVVSRLTLVELFLERASDAWSGLQVLETASPGRFEISKVIASGTGPLRRQIDSGYRATDYDFISATTEPGDSISFTLDTRRARTEVRAQSTQGRLLRELVASASTDTNDDPRLGRTLFQLLVPLELEPFLGGTSQMLLELDAGTASIPWELLDTQDERHRGADPRPWAIRAKLLRKLRKESYREVVHDAGAEDAVLVIGEPKCDPEKYDPLPGARAEAEAVAEQIAGAGGIGADRVTALLDAPDATSVINALLERCYRVVHIAGHGEPGMAGGVVLSGDTFLGPREIKTMRTVPELVFVNCCHLAKYDAGGTLTKPKAGSADFDRSVFAAGVADQLIEIGVRCVIAAGWAVEDAPAKVFAVTFYREIFGGAAFIDAVSTAREASWAEGGNSWAAYQCYGDPNWTWRSDVGDAQAGTSIRDQYDGISSPLGLALALEELAVQSTWMGAAPLGQLERTRHLEARFAALWGGMGAVAEAFATAYHKAGDRNAAITWYERALRANDASASLKAHENLGNLLARRAWERVDKLPQGDGAPPPGPQAYAQARDEITHALRGLQALAGLQPTAERHSLCGSAWKRLAMIEQRAGDSEAERAALQVATDCYERAEALTLADGLDNLFYPALNRMALELVTRGGQRGWKGFDASVSAAVRKSLAAKNHDDPDFWSVVGGVEIDLFEAVARRRVGDLLEPLLAAYADLHTRMTGRSEWRSVADQADLVLTPYVQRASSAEAAATRRLLEVLKGYAGG